MKPFNTGWITLSTNNTSGSSAYNYTGAAAKGVVQANKEEVSNVSATPVNVPPVVGMSPEEIGKELRTLFRRLHTEMVQNGNNPNGIQPAPTNFDIALSGANGYSGNANDYFQQAETLEAQLSNLWASLDGLISEIEQIAKLRKPSEIRKRAFTLRTEVAKVRDTVRRERRSLRNAGSNLSVAVGRLTDVVNKAKAQQGLAAPSGVTPLIADITRAYSLAQSLPATDGAPKTREDSTIRAITAILKAHHGVDPLGSFADVPVPDAPLVLMHYMEKPQENGNGAAHESAWGVGPYRIITVSDDGVEHDWQKNDWIAPYRRFLDGGWNMGYADDNDIAALNVFYNNGVELTSEWNGGDCSLEIAHNVLRLMRSQYSTKGIELRDQAGNVLCKAEPREPVLFFDPPKVSKPKTGALSGYEGPFRIKGVSNMAWGPETLEKAIVYIGASKRFGSPAEVLPDLTTVTKRWNNGDCKVKAALDMLRVARAGYSTSRITLADAKGRTVARVGKYEKVEPNPFSATEAMKSKTLPAPFS